MPEDNDAMSKVDACVTVPDEPILRFLAEHIDEWCTWGKGYAMPTVKDAMPAGTSDEVQHAKMRDLMKRGLVDGCACGCRGDFEITHNGLAALARSAKAKRI